MNVKRILLVTLIAVAVIASVSAVSAGWFGWGDDSADDTSDVEEIKLIKESTKGVHSIYDNGEEKTNYELRGVIKGLPKDGEGYTLRTAIYDKNGKLLKEGDEFYRMTTLSNDFKKSEPNTLSIIEIDGFKKIKFFEIKVYDPNGELVLEKNLTFKMENIDTIYHESSSASSSSSTSSSSSSSSSSNSVFNNYIGNAATGKFHSSSCNDVGKMDPSNMVFFSSRDDAINQGYEPCGHCWP